MMGGIYEIDGKKVVQFGGRSDGVYELGKDENVIWIPAKGEVYNPAPDLIVAITYGEVQVVRGRPLFKTDATVHSKWKVKRNQEVLIYREINSAPQYEVYSYTDGSYMGCVVEIYREGQKVFDYSGGKYKLRVLRNLKLAAVISDGMVCDFVRVKYV